jgi:hypothetical protein
MKPEKLEKGFWCDHYANIGGEAPNNSWEKPLIFLHRPPWRVSYLGNYIVSNGTKTSNV